MTPHLLTLRNVLCCAYWKNSFRLKTPLVFYLPPNLKQRRVYNGRNQNRVKSKRNPPCPAARLPGTKPLSWKQMGSQALVPQKEKEDERAMWIRQREEQEWWGRSPGWGLTAELRFWVNGSVQKEESNARLGMLTTVVCKMHPVVKDASSAEAQSTPSF